MSDNTNLGLRKRMMVNTLSNYGRMLLGLFITIFMTRIIFLGLSREEYGLWAVMWSIFGYSLLFDFGFGTAVQKYTSETKVTEDWEHYNKLVSTIFFNYVFLAVVVFGLAFLLGNNLQHLLQFKLTHIEYYRIVFIMFGIGTAVVFPYGFYTEILHGLQELHVRNIIQASFMVLNFVMVYLAMRYHYNLIGLTIATMVTNLGGNLMMVFIVHKKLPKFTIKIQYYDRKMIKKVMSFSIYAYLITFTNLIIFRTDQLVISVFASVALVAVYQIASRLAETYRQFAAQFLDNLSPIAATLFAAGKHEKMGEIMIQSNRLMGMISTVMIIPLLVYVKPLLQIWLNLNDQSGTICAIVLLLSMYTLLAFRSSSVYILIMANEQKRLTYIALLECALNLGMSIFLLYHIDSYLKYFGIHIPNANIIGVAVGTLIPNMILAAFFNIPVACKFCKITIGEYFKISVWRNLIVGLIIFAFAVLLQYISYPNNLLKIVIYSILIGIVYLLVYFRLGLDGWERKQALEFVSNKLKRR
ncbi:MAG TPA: oligosaccharide flippase family protein [Candidatus Cloacimonadota bacterium]|nr:oligosaccharide flippase family protein [Candidatus Cloacimonadota bacterium]